MFNVSSCDYSVSVVLESAAKPSSAAQAWLGRRFKNHCRTTRVVGTHFHQDGTLKTTMNICNSLVDLDLKLSEAGKG